MRNQVTIQLKFVLLVAIGMSMLVSCSKYSKKNFEGEWGIIKSENMFVHNGIVYSVVLTNYLEFSDDKITETYQYTIDDEVIFSFDISGKWDYNEESSIFRLIDGKTKGYISIVWDLDSFNYEGDGESFNINYDEILNKYEEWNEENNVVDVKNKEREEREKNRKSKHQVSLRTVHGWFVKEVNKEHLIIEGADDELIEYDKL